MSRQLIEIAKRLKRVREQNEMSLEWAATAFELSPVELQAYESGEEEIPVSFLYLAAKKYGVELSELLTGEEPRQQFYSVTRKEEGVAINRRKEYDYQSLCIDFANKKIEPLLVTVPFEKESSQTHFNSHPGQEFHFLLKGRLEVTINKDAIVLEPGDSLIFQSEQKHSLKALGKGQAEVLVIII